jgi:N-acetylmuramoyl-L-alanine amidase
MQITQHRLNSEQQLIRFHASPNMGGQLAQTYMVIHFTAATTLDGAEATFANPAAKVSAHLVIDRDGSILQMVPFNRVAWHAGISRWRGLEGLNSHSIGVELVNAGRLVPTVSGGSHGTARKYPPTK